MEFKFYDGSMNIIKFGLSNVFVARLDKIPNGVKAGDDAIDYSWYSIYDLPEMAFDHREILDGIIKK